MAKKKVTKKAAVKAPVKEVETEAESSGGPEVELLLCEIESIFTLGPGSLMSGLSDDQHRRRAHNLEFVEGDEKGHDADNVYRCKSHCQFKAGEKVMLNPTDIPKSQKSAVKVTD